MPLRGLALALPASLREALRAWALKWSDLVGYRSEPGAPRRSEGRSGALGPLAEMAEGTRGGWRAGESLPAEVGDGNRGGWRAGEPRRYTAGAQNSAERPFQFSASLSFWSDLVGDLAFGWSHHKPSRRHGLARPSTPASPSRLLGRRSQGRRPRAALFPIWLL